MVRNISREMSLVTVTHLASEAATVKIAKNSYGITPPVSNNYRLTPLASNDMYK